MLLAQYHVTLLTLCQLSETAFIRDEDNRKSTWAKALVLLLVPWDAQRLALGSPRRGVWAAPEELGCYFTSQLQSTHMQRRTDWAPSIAVCFWYLLKRIWAPFPHSLEGHNHNRIIASDSSITTHLPYPQEVTAVPGSNIFPITIVLILTSTSPPYLRWRQMALTPADAP